jgi:mono/diheme cytochrome c family protein
MSRLLLAAFFTLAVSSPLAADEVGKQEYMVACAICHGESGKGGGPFAPLLNIETPNLTTIAAGNDGVFPFLDVLMVVDGRTGVRAHGDSAMPIWGERFQASATGAGPFGTELEVRGRLLALVTYIESIQE